MDSPAASAFVLLWIIIQVHLSTAASRTQLDWEWSHNSLGQDPCAVLQILEAKCKNLTSYTLGPLSPGTNYLTPQQGEAPGCSCNTVTYSLYQACSQCQIPEAGNTWTFYDKFCVEVYVTQIPLDIPNDTKVPLWAYLNVTKEDNFNLTAARVVVGSNSSISLPSVTMSSGLAEPSPSTPNRTGAIVGGIIGGATVIGLSIASIFLWVLRKKPDNRRRVKAERKETAEESLISPGPLSPPQITRDLPTNATYRQLSRSGVMTAYDSSFYPKNVVAPSQNGYHGFAEV